MRDPQRPLRRRPQTLAPCLLALAVAAGSLAPPALPVARAQPAPPQPLQLPALGDETAEVFDVLAERRLGDRVMREVRRDPAYLDDPLLLEYAESLWQPLLAAARRKGEITPDLDPRLAWELFLVRDRSVNAFALPGGYVGVHLGLIGLTRSRDELASVLAHELSHVTQRHIARGFANSRRQSMIALAGMLLGVLAAGRANSVDGVNAAVVGGQAATVQGELNFSRELEREADRVGYAVLTQAGFSPAGMAAMFERLETASRLNDSGGFPYLRTHPLTSERIAEARARGGLPARGAGAATPAAAVGAFEHALSMGRARVLADPRDESLARIVVPGEAEAASPPERLGATAAAALAAGLRRDAVAADAALRQARSQLAAAARQANTPGDGARRADLLAAQRHLALLAAQLATARGDGAAAAAELAPWSSNAARPVRLALADAALAQADAPPALLRARAESLQTWLAGRPADAAAWQALAGLWRRLDHPLRAVRAEAEARYALGDWTGASDRLRAGQQAARRTPAAEVDAIESAVIDARLREVEALRRQQFLEERGQAPR